MSRDDPKKVEAGEEVTVVRTLLANHLPALEAFVRLRMDPRLRSRESSGDVVQSVCREVLENPGQFAYQGENAFRNWLFTAVRRKLVDRHRGQGRLERAFHLPPGPREPSASSDDSVLATFYVTKLSASRDAGIRESVELIEAAFDRLPDDLREVIMLARIADLPYAQVGQMMGRSEDAVRKLLARALARLMTFMAKPT